MTTATTTASPKRKSIAASRPRPFRGSVANTSDVRLIEVEPGRWRVDKTRHIPKRSDLPVPNVISDTMDATEQVDGKFYTSKRAFRAVGRSLGLTEVGNEKLPPITRSTSKQSTKEQRRKDIRVAIEKYKAGHRPQRRQE